MKKGMGSLAHGDFIKRYLDNCESISFDLKKQAKELNAAIDLLFSAWRNNKAVFIMGAGGSASTAEHLAGDLCKTINDKPGHRGLRASTPWDNRTQITAIINDRPKEDIFNAWLDNVYELQAVGIGISVHGGKGTDFGGKWSQFLLRGLQFMKDRGSPTIGLIGFDGGPMKDLVTVPIVVPANSTPLVEAFHVVVHHLIVFRLKELIEEYESSKSG